MSDAPLALAFVNEKTGKTYKIVSFDQEAGEVTLVGDFGVEFTDKYDKEMFQRLGYKLTKIEVPAA